MECQIAMFRRCQAGGLLPWIAALIVISVFVLSWLPSPRLAEQVPMPGLVAKWVDSHAHENLRTAVPFLLLGLVDGLRMLGRDAGRRAWIRSWLCLVLLALVAEAGQLPLPKRRFDLMDVLYGAAGGMLGLMLAALAATLVRLLRSLKALMSII